ncbi:hypothetical protein ABTZ59_26265 [Streptomyces sp. NPDC094034]|uniref:hypothetical protein n=1 Tax=Streptomyces sp. NPDC094034 TaxID=3155309 RepID=UPI00332FF694
MTPRFRTSCAIAVASLLLTAPAVYAEESAPPPPHASVAPEPEASSLAGRLAGEGKIRPGRPPEPDAEAATPEDVDPSASTQSAESADPARPDRPSSPAKPPAPSRKPSPSSKPAKPSASAPARTDEETADEWDTADAPGEGLRPPEEQANTGEPTAADSAPPTDPRRPDATALDRSATRPVPVLTLGAGITLLGLGLGFLGLRLRRR